MIVNRSNLRNMFVAFVAAFTKGLNSAEPDYSEFVMEVPSTTKSNEYGWLGKITKFREWIGDRVIQSLAQHGYTIKNKSFENTVGVDRDDIEDDNLGIYTPIMQQLGQDAQLHPAELVYDILQKGFTNKCYDGQNFFDTDHPVILADGSEGSVSNYGGGTGTAWYLFDTTQVIKPIIKQNRKPYTFVAKDKETDDNVFHAKEFIYGVDGRLNVGYGLWQLAYASKQELNEDNLNAAFDAMRSFKGDNGKPLAIKPTLLVVPPSLRKTARALLENDRNDAGATNSTKGLVKYMDTVWLS